MNIYMASIHANGYKHTKRYEHLNDQEKEVVNGLPHILESYHYINKQQYIDAIRQCDDKVFLDSGAFSAWTLGVKIDLPTYCFYIKEYEDIIEKCDDILVASVLDGIGDPLKTYRNQLEMEAYGVYPLPCFHFNEDERYLEWYVKNYEYITIGGMVGKSAKQLFVWLDRIWEKYLTDGTGNARIRVHGFGVTSIPIMKRYPWFSCDSSSWIQSAAFGTVIEPKHGPISISDKSPSKHTYGRHITTFSQLEREYVFNRFNEQGFNFERLSTVYESRAAYNLNSFGIINTTINKGKSNKFESSIQELF